MIIADRCREHLSEISLDHFNDSKTLDQVTVTVDIRCILKKVYNYNKVAGLIIISTGLAYTTGPTGYYMQADD